MKKVRVYLSSLLLMLVFACGFFGMETQAAPAKVTGLKQTWADTSSIELEWAEQSDEDVDYQVEYSTDKRNWQIEESTGALALAVISDLNAGSTYYVRVKSYVEVYNDETQESVKTFYPQYSDIVECVTTPEESPESINKKAATTTSITLTWDTVKDANAYVVEYITSEDYEYIEEDDEYYEEDDEYYEEDDEYYEEDDEYYEEDDEYIEEDDEYYEEDDEYYEEDDESEYVEPSRVTVTKNEVVLKNLKADTAYTVTVYAARKNSNGTFTAWEGGTNTVEEDIYTAPTKVTGVAVQKYIAKNGSVTVTCDEKDMADGFEAEIWTVGQKKEQKAAGISSDDNTIMVKKSSLKKARFFKVHVRAYTVNSDDSKTYGEWSDWVYLAQQPKITKSKATKKGITITWKKIEGADRYTIYASTKQKKGYTKVGTSKKTSFNIAKVNKKKLKKNAKYYFYVVAEKKVGKKFIVGETKAKPTYSSKKYRY